MTSPESLLSNDKVKAQACAQKILVIFDEQCLLCLGTVRFLHRLDKRDLLRFSKLGRSGLPDGSLILVDGEEVLLASSGVIRILKRIGGLWSIVGHLLQLIPVSWRDRIYHLIARNRSTWFGTTSCPVFSPGLREKIIDI